MPSPYQNKTVMAGNQMISSSIIYVAPVVSDMNHHRVFGKSLFPLLLLLSLFSLSLLVNPRSTRAEEGLKQERLEPQSFSDLNLRFSNRSLTPPDTLIVQTIPLTGISVASPFMAPNPQAVIFEDDRRQRVAVLSMDSSGTLALYLLEQLSLDPKLPALVQCANNRGCETDRIPLTGGLGCLAICIKEFLELSALNQ
jgi:hypothetical protein